MAVFGGAVERLGNRLDHNRESKREKTKLFFNSFREIIKILTKKYVFQHIF